MSEPDRLRRPGTMAGDDLKSLLEVFTYLQIARGAVNLGFALVVSVCWACRSSRVAGGDRRGMLLLMSVSPYLALVLPALGAWGLVST